MEKSENERESSAGAGFRHAFRIAFSGSVLRKTVPTALVVGAVLNSINQLPRLFHEKPLVWSKICLNACRT